MLPVGFAYRSGVAFVNETLGRRALLLVIAADLVGLLAGCASFPRHLEYATHVSGANHGAILDYAVYTPPGFDPVRERLPLVSFLHGGGDSEDAFDRYGVSAALDRSIEAGEAPRTVILLPDGDFGMWADWSDGSRAYETWVVDELMPLVRAEKNTLDCPDHCHVMGVSMGAMGALRFAHHRPEAFSTLTVISGAPPDTQRMVDFQNDWLISFMIPTERIFGPIDPIDRVHREDLFLQWTSPEATGMERIVLAWGSRDRDAIRQGGAAFSEHLEAHGIEHEAWEYEGRHAWTDWTPVILRALRHQLGDATARSAGRAQSGGR